MDHAPSAPGSDPAANTERLAREVHEIAQRARLGGWFYLGGWGLIVVMRGISNAPLLSMGIGVLFLLLATARNLVRVPRQPTLAQSSRLLDLIWGLVLGGAVLWATATAWILFEDGTDPVGVVALMCSIAFATAMVHTFCMRPWLAAFCVVLVFLPGLVVLWQTQEMRGLAAAVAVYLGYLGLLLARSHQEYQDRRRLEDELRQQRDRFEHLSRHDELTGLANRRRFEAELASLVRSAATQDAPFSLLVMDLDHFKQVNDRHGHAGGDACLVWFSERLRRHFDRSGETVARLGGEEFAVLLPGVDLDMARNRAEAFRGNLLSQPLQGAGGAIHVTVSIGVASSAAQPQANADMLYRAADRALYLAKERGRNRVVVAAADSYSQHASPAMHSA